MNTTATALRELILAARRAVACLPPSHPARQLLTHAIAGAEIALEADTNCHPLLSSIIARLATSGGRGKNLLGGGESSVREADTEKC